MSKKVQREMKLEERKTPEQMEELKKLRTNRLENGTWEARQVIDGYPYLGEGNIEDEAINDLMEAAGIFDRDNQVSADAENWG